MADDSVELFPGLPARHLAAQLLALEGMERLRRVAAHHPDPGDPDGDRLVGLLVLSENPLQVPLYPRPGAVPEPVAVERLVRREIAYEEPAAVVYAVRDDWYRVALEDGRFGWLREAAADYHPYDTLPVRRLGYLLPGWGGLLWPAPGAGLPMVAPGGTPADVRQRPVEVLESRRVGGGLWFRVRLPDADPCAGAGTPGFDAGGWVPGYGVDGRPVIWFHSRGC